MANVLVNDASLADIADAIREKNGTEETYKPAEMGDAVRAIESGGSEEFVGIKYSEFDSYRKSPKVADASTLPVDKDMANLFGGYNYLFANSSKYPNGGFNTLLRDVYLPNGLTRISANMFLNCGSLDKIYGDFSELEVIYDNAFRGSGIQIFDYYMPKLSVIEASSFNAAPLKALTLRGASIATLSNINAFTGTPIASGTGYIYVPKALIETYKAATNWVTYANMFRALEDYTVDGTVTGALDESKIAA